jgi:uncharacterized protein
MRKSTRLLCASLLGLAACDGRALNLFDGSPEPAGAAEPDLLAAKSWVTDAAHILDDRQEVRLTQQLQLLERKMGHQMVVATVPTLEGKAIEEYSLNLARRSGIGRREHNDGIMVLVAPNERKVRIEVGTGLEQVVTNSFASTVIQNDMIPRFKEGDYDAGISAGVATLIDRLTSR